MKTINNFKLIKSNKNIFSNKPYKALSKVIIVIYGLFMLVYMFRDHLYKLNN